MEKKPVKFIQSTAKEDKELPAGRPGTVTPEDGSVAARLDDLMSLGLSSGATEIHIEPMPDKTRVRLRVHGRLVEHESHVDPRIHPKLVNRIKVLGLMDISKRGVAQKGYGKIEYDGRQLDMVMMIVPTPYGEKAMLRVGYMSTLGVTLDQLGMYPQMLSALKKLLERPNGMILVAGTPGSGRTTTCYTCVQYLNRPDKNVCTMERDLRYQIPGVIQGKPEERFEYTYLDGLRATIALEPDVLYVGDLNDDEASRMSLAASFGKRIVIGRLNAKNGATAILTLLDMGLPGFLVASGVIGVLSQRLVRRLCEACREPYKPNETVLAELGIKPVPELVFYTAKGCAQCGNTGFRGQLGVFELFVLSEKVQEKVIARASAHEISEAAAQSGLVPLRMDGVSKVSRGFTTLEEVLARL